MQLTSENLLEPRPWSRARCWWTAGAVFAAQVLLVFLPSNRFANNPGQSSSNTIYRLAAPAPGGQPLGEMLEVGDPTMFALVNPRGFSGPAWLHQTEFDYAPARWSETPGWLNLREADLGSAFAQFIRTHSAITEPTRGTAVPISIAPVWFQETAMTQSVVQIEGPLAERSLLFLPSLPIQQHSDVLTNSIVQVGINAEGYPESARLLSGSGSKKADQDALTIAKAARFAAQPNHLAKPAAIETDLTWGKLNFQWFTVELMETNKPSMRP